VKTPVKLGLFGLALVLIFAAAWGAGSLAGPSRPGAADTDGHGQQHEEAAGAARVPGGLQVAQDGYRLEVTSTQLSTTDRKPFTFKVIGPDGKPVTAYTVRTAQFSAATHGVTAPAPQTTPSGHGH